MESEENQRPPELDRQLLISVLSGRATPAELEAFEAWLQAHPENDATFRRYARTWKLIGKLDPASFPEERDPKELPFGREPVLVQPATGRPVSQVAPGRAGSGRLSRPLLAAASIIVGIGIGSILSLRSNSFRFGPEEIASGAQAVTVSLTDGTTVRLAPNSRLSVRPDVSGRSVFLSGQGFFAVPSDQAEPFRVFVDGGELVVHGTRFDILAQDKGIQVVVVEGQVEIDAQGERLSVDRNHIGRAGDGAGLRVEAVDDVFREISWMGDFVVFESTPLSEVAHELNRRFGVQVEIADTSLATRTVTAAFQDQTPYEMLTGICLAVDALCTATDNAVQVRERPTDEPR